ncbi:disulfide bond formation protein B, partial [Escherichia coli]|nr:disulfide bond formation protein B [Escherichia coli]
VICSVANPFGAPAGALFSCRYIYLTRSKSELRVV